MADNENMTAPAEDPGRETTIANKDNDRQKKLLQALTEKLNSTKVCEKLFADSINILEQIGANAQNAADITTLIFLNTVNLLLESFTEVATWNDEEEIIIYLAEHTEKFNISLDMLDKLLPFIQTEFQKPEYNNLTIADLDTETAFYLLKKLLATADGIYRDGLPKLNINRAQFIDNPLDKVNSTVWNLLEEDTAGQLTLAMESTIDKRKNKKIDLIYSINFDAFNDNIAITKRLLPFDKRVYMATAAVSKAGYDVFSVTQIYYAMGYSKKPNERDLLRINDSLTKMRSAIIYVNNTCEVDARYRYPKFVYDGALLPFERESAFINGKYTESAIHIFREPPLIEFARNRKQITTFPIKLLQSPLNKTDSNLLLEDYLLERIAKAKNKTGSNRILYKTIYEHIKLYNESTTNKKAIKKRLPDKINKYLTHYQKCDYINGYIMSENGITIRLD